MLDNIGQYDAIDSNEPYPAYDGHPASWLVVPCNAEGKRISSNAVVTYGKYTEANGDWYTYDETGMHIDVPALIAAFPATATIYLSQYNNGTFDYICTKTTMPEGLVKDVLDVKRSVSGVQAEIEALHKPRLVLPAETVAVVGHEWNLYADNVVQILGDSYYLHVAISPAIAKPRAMMLDRNLRITPDESDIGDHTMTVTLRSKYDNSIAQTATMTLHVIADTSVTGKHVLFIGDSLTDAGIYPAEIQHNLSNGGIVSLGTRTDTVTIDGASLTVNHEGRAGWASYDYTRSVSNYRTDVDNAFWDGAAFNFGWYMEQQGYTELDAVCIGLGTNGLGKTETVCAALDEMIASIRQYSATVPILVALTAPPAKQDGCGINVGLQYSDDLKVLQIEMVEEYLRRYQGTSDANLDVIELYFHLDCENDFNTVTQSVSARNPAQIVRQNNNVHPSVYGYLHFADAYYNRLLYHLTK